MADDTLQTGSDMIATDHVTTLNGAAVTQSATSPKVQRVKVAYGDDGTSRDVSDLFPLPIARQQDGTATGTITATDAVLGTHGGQGVPLSGTPTPGSYVAYPTRGGDSGFTLRLSGTIGGGTVWVESSTDSTDGINGLWTTNLVRQSGVDQTFLDASLTSLGVFRGVAAGYSYLRVRITGATTPNIAVAFRASAGSSVTAQVAPLPPGSNQIGNIGYIRTATRGAASSNIEIASLIAPATAVNTTTQLIAAPATGLSIYVTDMEGSNEGAAGTRVTLYEGTTARVARFMTGAGGGFVTNLGTPWKLPAATALQYQVSVATTWHMAVSFYIAP